ncbi:MAG: DUF1318 domain-containing protein [Desulfosalsimonadaceae bacterium]
MTANFKKYLHFRILLVLAPLLLSACTLAQVDVEMVSERTALENQVLGTYNSLDAQMLLAASVRGVDSATGAVSEPPRHSRAYKEGIDAMQTLDFHRDDLHAFKRLGWVGENNRGYIKARGMEKKDAAGDLQEFVARYTREEFEHVVSEVNAARKVLMERVIYLNEDLKESDMDRIERVFAQIHAEDAPAGTKIQKPDGSWHTKKEA